jgi:hypothetical protein
LEYEKILKHERVFKPDLLGCIGGCLCVVHALLTFLGRHPTENLGNALFLAGQNLLLCTVFTP